MKILLLNSLSNKEDFPPNPPLNLLYLASSLRDKHDVWILDLDALKYDSNQVKNRLIKENPDVIGITCTTLSYNNMVKTCHIIKQHLKKTILVIGGVHVTVKPKESLKETKADYAIVGEGEISFSKLLENPKKHPKIIEGKKRIDLDDKVFPSRDILEPSIFSYVGNAPRFTNNQTVMMWSRGCPFNCLFCSHAIYKGQKTIFRSPTNIIEELKELKRIGIKELFVYDDELIGLGEKQSAWLEQVCKLIVKNKLDDLIFKCQGRCSDTINLNLLKLMKRAGFKCIMWGCESGSDNVLKAIRKGTSVEQIKRAIRLCKQAGIKAWMFLIVGNYTETENDLKKTIQLVKETKPNYVQVTYSTPYPGEYLDLCEKENLILENDKSKWNTHIPVVKTQHLTEEQLVFY
ncbi:MAG: B12-binding domain-containing radical SAM protein, partial [Nanoarchaeota archaeon]|nr:B12-binding domain-containing radical SAM protein [Nanoarchaeota archaeon]